MEDHKKKHEAKSMPKRYAKEAERSIKNIKKVAEKEIAAIRLMLNDVSGSHILEHEELETLKDKEGVKIPNVEAFINEPTNYLPVGSISYFGGSRKGGGVYASIITGSIGSIPDNQKDPIDEDDVDIEGVDPDDVYVRSNRNRPIFSKTDCSPFGTPTCTTRPGFVIYNEYKDPEFTNLKLGTPNVSRDGATVCVTVPRTMVARGKVRTTYYRRTDCSCPADDWTELSFYRKGPWVQTEELETPLAPWTHCDTDWTRFTINLFKDLLKSAANGIGSGIGGGIGGAVGGAIGDPLGDLLEDIIGPIADDIKKELSDAGIELSDDDDD